MQHEALMYRKNVLITLEQSLSISPDLQHSVNNAITIIS